MQSLVLAGMLLAALIFGANSAACAAATTSPIDKPAKLAEVEQKFLSLPRVSKTELETKDWVNRFLIYQFDASDAANAELINYLREQYRSDDPMVSLHALFALATLKQDWTFEPLVSNMQHHRNGFIRGYAARGLGQLGDKRAIPYLEQALDDQFQDDSRGDVTIPFVRECARVSLNELYGYRKY